MNGLRVTLWLPIFLTLLSTVQSRPVSFRLSEKIDHQQLPLRWENVEAAPLLVAGKQPTVDLSLGHHGLHLVELGPSESTTVLVEENTLLRLFSPDQELTADDVELWVSDGNGLEQPAEPLRSADRQSLFYYSASWHSVLVTVHRQASHASPLRLAPLIARLQLDRANHGYRDAARLSSAGTVRLAKAALSKSATYHVLTPQHSVRHSAPDVGRYALVTRIPYGVHDTALLQNYDVRVRFGKQVFHFPLATTFDSTSVFYVNAVRTVLGAERTVYFDVPEGTEGVTVEADAAIYCRLLYEEHDTLLDRPPERTSVSPLWSSPQAATLGPSLFHHESLGGQLIRIAEDRSVRDAGRAAAMLAWGRASAWAIHPQDRAFAKTIYRRYTRYRSLLPVRKIDASPAITVGFRVPGLPPPFPEAKDLCLSSALLPDALRGLASAPLVRVPNSEANAHEYRIPAGSGPSFLRLLVPREELTKDRVFHVQIDEHPPIPIRVQRWPGETAPKTQADGFTDAALSAFLYRSGTHTTSAAYGPLSLYRRPAPLRELASLVIPLAPNASRVRTWSPATNTAESSPYLGVQFRTTSLRELSEREYFAKLRRATDVTPSANVFWSSYRQWAAGRPFDLAAWQPISNEWLPLFRRLKALQTNLQWQVQAPSWAVDTNSQRDTLDVYFARSRAQKLANDGHWLAALELWSIVARESRDAEHRLSELERVTALFHLGENFLAEQQLRGLFLHAEDPQLRREAYRRLSQHYIQHSDSYNQLRVLAIAAMESGESAQIRKLATSLQEEGSFRQAMAIALSLPWSEAPLETILTCADTLRWWDTFNEALARLPELEKKHFWRGVRAARGGDYAVAARLLRQAGERGAAFAESLERSLDIRDRLADPRLETRLAAIFDWEDWQSRYPGPSVWRTDPSLAVDYDGAVLVNNPERDAHDLHYRATPWRAVRASVLGPLRCRIAVRPLHADPSTLASPRPLSGWVEIRYAGRLLPLAVRGNAPTSLELVGNAERPGGVLTAELELGPGLHEVEVLSSFGDAIVQFETEQATLRFGVLPPLTPATLAAALGQPRPLLYHPTDQRLLLLTADGQTKTIPGLLSVNDWTQEALVPSQTSLDPVLAARVSLRVESGLSEDHTTGLELIAAAESEGMRIAASERLLAMHRLKTLNRLWSSATLARGHEDVEVDATLLAAGAYSELVRRRRNSDDPLQTLRRATHLAYMVDQDPSLKDEVVAEAQSLVRDHPALRGLKELLAPLTGVAEWEFVRSITSSYGLRFVDVESSSVSSPALRTRSALLPELAPDERRLAGKSRLGMNLRTDGPAALVFDLAPTAVRFVRQESLTVIVQLDDQLAQRVTLERQGAWTPVSVPLPSGHHVVRLWIDEPMANQYVRVRFRRLDNVLASLEDEDEVAVSTQDDDWFAAPRQRRYHVSTPDVPLVVSVVGPTRLRIEEWQDGRSKVRYQNVAAGVRKITLAPPADQPEALFRVFAQRFRSDQISVPLRLSDSSPPLERLQLPSLRVEPSNTPVELVTEDAYPLGGQEDGTWSIRGLVRRRRLFDEDDTGRVDINEYAAIHGMHRYFSDYYSTYFESGILARTHDQRGSTLGAWEEIHAEPSWFPTAIRLRADGFLHWPDADGHVPHGDTEWSLLGRGAFSRRFVLAPRLSTIPSVGVFGRVLSLDDDDDFGFEDLDPDVFTNYKRDHRWGFTFADTLVYQPWLDFRVWTRVSVTSNEDFHSAWLDNFRARAGFSQFVHGLEFGGHYQVARFFNDGDRSGGSTSQRVSVEALYDLWATPRDRVEFGVTFEHDLSDGEYGGFISLTWDYSNGRGYRDFSPRAVSFRRLREARIPAEHNNSLREDP